MKDELLQQIEALIAEPIELLNLPYEDLLHWADSLFTLAEIVEDRMRVLAGYEVSNGRTEAVDNETGQA